LVIKKLVPLIIKLSSLSGDSITKDSAHPSHHSSETARFSHARGAYFVILTGIDKFGIIVLK
jgi:hypothetical protein